MNIIYIIIWFGLINIIKQENLPIYIDEIESYIEVDSIPQIVTYNIGDTAIAEIFVRNIMGAAEFKLTDNFSNILVKGNYVNSLDILKSYITINHLESQTEELKIFEYYYPLKDKKWIYFNNEGHMIRTEFYEHGVMLSCDGC